MSQQMQKDTDCPKNVKYDSFHCFYDSFMQRRQLRKYTYPSILTRLISSLFYSYEYFPIFRQMRIFITTEAFF